MTAVRKGSTIFCNPTRTGGLPRGPHPGLGLQPAPRMSRGANYAKAGEAAFAKMEKAPRRRVFSEYQIIHCFS